MTEESETFESETFESETQKPRASRKRDTLGRGKATIFLTRLQLQLEKKDAKGFSALAKRRLRFKSNAVKRNLEFRMFLACVKDEMKFWLEDT